MIRILVFGMTSGMGGVESYLMNLYRNIDRRMIQFDFVVDGNSCYYSKEIEKLGGKIFYVTPKKENVFKNIKDLACVFKQCKQTHKIVYFNLSVLYYNVPFILARVFRYPKIIAHAHNTKAKNMKKNIRYILHCLNRVYVSKKSDYLFACSYPAGEWVLGKNAVRKEKVRIIPNAIKTDEFIFDIHKRNDIRSRLGIKNNQFVVGHIGRFTYQKNHSFLIDIFRAIKDIEKDAVLLLVGDGELYSQIKEKIIDLGLKDSVILTGQRSDIPFLLNAMDVFVFPSYYEGFGIVLVEAQASGLYCYASKEAVPKEVNITGNVKFIGLNETERYWAKEIIDSSKNYVRRDMANIIKSSGYDINEMAKNFLELVLKINEI